jgi:hypothetical protein
LVVVDSTKLVVTNAGNIGIGTASPSARQHIVTGGVSTIGAIIQAAAGQTANLQEWRDSGGVARGYMSWLGTYPIFNLMDNGSGLGQYSFNEVKLLNNRIVLQAALSGTARIYYSGAQSFDVQNNNNGSAVTHIFGVRMLDPNKLSSSSAVQVGINIYPDINQSGTAGYRMLQVNPTETAIGSGEKYLAWFGRGGSFLSGIDRTGAYQPASLADADAANSTVYYSTTQSKLVYKDGGGVVNDLY